MIETSLAAPAFRIWGVDDVVYGPVDLPALVHWVQEERVTADTWIFLEHSRSWLPAARVPELKLFFSPNPTGNVAAPPRPVALDQAGWKIKLGSLRRMRLFAGLDEQQLVAFVQYLEIIRFRPFSTVVRLGELCDAMYLVLEGELRARVMVDGKETTLSTLSTGEFFGEIALLDEGPRSADVLANQESVLLRISATAFNKMMREAPQLALPFLFALSRSVASRVRSLTKRYQDSIHFLHLVAAKG